MIQNLTGNTNIRSEMLILLKDFSDLEYQQKTWLKNIGYFENILEDFINDYDFDKLTNCLDEINGIFYDENEARGICLFYKKIFKMDQEVKSNNFQDFYNHPNWISVVKLAESLYKIMRNNSRKYSILGLKNFIINHDILQLKDSIRWILADAFFDKNEQIITIKISKMVEELYKSFDKNKLESLHISSGWSKVIDLVKNAVAIFEDNNQKYNFEGSLNKTDKRVEEIKQLELQEKYLEFRVKAAELLWKKFVNWHRYRRKRRTFR
jgi:hypothetical protein